MTTQYPLTCRIAKSYPKDKGGVDLEEHIERIERRKFIHFMLTDSLSLMAGLAAFIGTGFLYPIKKRKPPMLFVCMESE